MPTWFETASRYCKNTQFRSASTTAGLRCLDDPEGFSDRRQDIRGAQKFVPLVRRAHNRAQPRLTLRHRGEPPRRRKPARLEQLLRELKRLGRITHMDGDNRCLAHLELEPALFELPLEEFRVRPELLHQALALGRIQQGKRCLAGGGCGWRMRG